MNNIVLLTFDEINRIEDEYARKNKHKSYGLQNHIGDREKIIACYYVQNKNFDFCVLTDLKLLFNPFASTNKFFEVKLSEISQLQVNSTGFLGQGGIKVCFKNSSWNPCDIFMGIKDAVFLEGLTGAIQKAIANLDVRRQSAAININATQNNIADQLAKLADLYNAKVLTEDEYKRAKERVLTNSQ